MAMPATPTDSADYGGRAATAQEVKQAVWRFLGNYPARLKPADMAACLDHVAAVVRANTSEFGPFNTDFE